MQLHKILAVLAATGVALSVSAQQAVDTNSPATNALALLPGQREMRLTMKDCINLALSNNLGIKISSYTANISVYTLGGDYAPYDPTLNMSASRSHTESPPQLNVNTNL